jgi:hypothetical protein
MLPLSQLGTDRCHQPPGCSKVCVMGIPPDCPLMPPPQHASTPVLQELTPRKDSGSSQRSSVNGSTGNGHNNGGDGCSTRRGSPILQAHAEA